MAVTKRGFLKAILAAAALTFISSNTNSPHTLHSVALRPSGMVLVSYLLLG